jgi:large subunit ribosomal protein L17
MRHLKSGRKLNRTSAHRKAMFRNLVTSLIEHEQVRTTDAKAKELRRVADRMITLAKRGSLHARRQALSYIRSRAVVAKLFDEVAARFRERPGGYTRGTNVGHRTDRPRRRREGRSRTQTRAPPTPSREEGPPVRAPNGVKSFWVVGCEVRVSERTSGSQQRKHRTSNDFLTALPESLPRLVPCRRRWRPTRSGRRGGAAPGPASPRAGRPKPQPDDRWHRLRR